MPTAYFDPIRLGFEANGITRVVTGVDHQENPVPILIFDNRHFDKPRGRGPVDPRHE